MCSSQGLQKVHRLRCLAASRLLSVSESVHTCLRTCFQGCHLTLVQRNSNPKLCQYFHGHLYLLPKFFFPHLYLFSMQPGFSWFVELGHDLLQTLLGSDQPVTSMLSDRSHLPRTNLLVFDPYYFGRPWEFCLSEFVASGYRQEAVMRRVSWRNLPRTKKQTNKSYLLDSEQVLQFEFS